MSIRIHPGVIRVVAAAATIACLAASVIAQPAGRTGGGPAPDSAEPRIAAPASPRVIRDVSYRRLEGVDPARTSLDLHLPAHEDAAAPARPVMIMVHGGGWARGDKANPGVVAPKAEWFLERGWILVSTNYRLSPSVTSPAHAEDVAHAVAWVHANIAEHGGDPARIAIMGHSAGAHIAALTAVETDRLVAAGAPRDVLKAAILLDGAAYDVPSAMRSATRVARPMYEAAFGTDSEAWPASSPMRNVKKDHGTPPFLILHIDRARAKRQAEGLAAALARQEIRADVVESSRDTHATINRGFGGRRHFATRTAGAFLDEVMPASSTSETDGDDESDAVDASADTAGSGGT